MIFNFRSMCHSIQCNCKVI